jgi:hypothetical protein
MDSATGKNKYTASVAFGNNVFDGAYSEAMIDGYEIHITDIDGTVLANTGKSVAKKVGDLNCCSSQLYNESVSGDWPTGARGFLIVPFSGSGSSKAVLPVGTAHTLLAGSETASAVALDKATVKTKLGGLTAETCDKLYNNPSILLAAHVATINNKSTSTTKIPVSNCVMKELKPCATGGRRLQAADSSLEYTTETLIPSNFGLDQAAIQAIPSTELIANIVEESLKQLGFTPTIASATSTVEPIASVSTGSEAAQPTGDARRGAGSFLSSIIVLISMIAGPKFLA